MIFLNGEVEIRSYERVFLKISIMFFQWENNWYNYTAGQWERNLYN